MLIVETKINGVGTKTLEINETPSPKLSVSFERPSDFKGKFGFDWYRDYYEDKLVDTTKQKDLQDEYTPKKIDNKRYYVPWLTLKKGQSAKLKLKINIEDKIKGSQKDNFIILPKNKGLTFEPAEIKLSEINKKKEFDIKVKCVGTLNTDECLAVTLKYSEKKIGYLNVLRNKTDYNVNIRFVKVVAYSGEKYLNKNDHAIDYQFKDKEYSSEEEYLNKVVSENKIADFIQENSLNQALINATIDKGDYTIVLDTDAIEKFKINGYSIGKSKGFRQYLFAQYEETYEKDQSSKDIVIFITVLKTNSGAGGETSLYNASVRSIIIYELGLKNPTVYVHEIGHVLGCEHSFLDLEDNWTKYQNSLHESIRNNLENIDDKNSLLTTITSKLNIQSDNIAKNEANIIKMKQYPNNPKALNNIKISENNIYKSEKSIDHLKETEGQIKDFISSCKERIESNKIKLNQLDDIKERNPYRFNNQKTSCNFMDYTNDKNDFYKWQWLAMQNELKTFF